MSCSRSTLTLVISKLRREAASRHVDGWVPLPKFSKLRFANAAVADRPPDLAALHHLEANFGAVRHPSLAHPQPIAGLAVRAAKSIS
jgi:hypothetical protein